MYEGDATHPRPALTHRHGDLTHLGRGHGRVGLVLEILHAPSPGLLPHHTGEEDEATCPGCPTAAMRRSSDSGLTVTSTRSASEPPLTGGKRHTSSPCRRM